MKRSITSTADGRCARIAGVASSASSRSANWIASTALAFGSGTSATFASRTTPSVPSEPTISFARLNGCRRIDERVEVVAADAAEHLRDSGARSRPRTSRAVAPDLAIARRLERVAPRTAASSSRRRRAAGSARAIRPTARRAARARDRWSCRRAPSARRSSCWPSCRRWWRGWRSRCRARSAGRAAAAPRSARRARCPARRAPSAPRRSPRAARLKYFEVSTMRPLPIAWPACDVPPPRIVSGQRCVRQICDRADDVVARLRRRRRRAARSGRRWRRWNRARATPRRTGPRPRVAPRARAAARRCLQWERARGPVIIESAEDAESAEAEGKGKGRIRGCVRFRLSFF